MKVSVPGEGVLLVMENVVHHVRELGVITCGKAAHVDVVVQVASVGFLPVLSVAVGIPVAEVSRAVVDVGVIRVAGHVPAVQVVRS